MYWWVVYDRHIKELLFVAKLGSQSISFHTISGRESRSIHLSSE